MDTQCLADGLQWVWVTVAGVSGWTASIQEWGQAVSPPVTDTTAEIISQLEARITALETAMKNAGLIFANVNGKEL